MDVILTFVLGLITNWASGKFDKALDTKEVQDLLRIKATDAEGSLTRYWRQNGISEPDGIAILDQAKDWLSDTGLTLDVFLNEGFVADQVFESLCADASYVKATESLIGNEGQVFNACARQLLSTARDGLLHCRSVQDLISGEHYAVSVDTNKLLKETMNPKLDEMLMQMSLVVKQTAYMPSYTLANKLALDKVRSGVSYREAFRLDEALATFQSVLEECSEVLAYSDKAAVHANMAVVYRDVGDLDSAEHCFGEALALDGDNYSLQTNIALLACDRGDLELAQERLSGVLASHGDDPYVILVQSVLLACEGQIDESLEQLNAHLELKPDSADGYVNRGISHRVKGNYDAALKDFELACGLCPTFILAQGLRLETIAYSADISKDAKGPDYVLSQTDMVLGLISYHLPKPPVALQTALTHIRTARGIAYMTKGSFEDAEREFQVTLEYEDDPVAFSNLGMVFLRRGDLDSAHKYYCQAVDHGSDTPMVFHNIINYQMRVFSSTWSEDTLLDAKNYLQLGRERCGSSSEIDYLEAMIICLESQSVGADMGIGRAKGIFDKVLHDNNLPIELQMVAFENLEAASELEKVIGARKHAREVSVLRLWDSSIARWT